MTTGMSQWEPMIAEAEQANGLPAGLLWSVIAQESKGDPAAVSKRGARGLAQFMPDTAAQPGWGIKPFNPDVPEEAIPAAGKYLKALLDKHGDLHSALAAWNWGTGNVDKRGTEKLPGETGDFIRKVMVNYQGRGSGEFTRATAFNAPIPGGVRSDTPTTADPFEIALGSQPNTVTTPQGGDPFDVAITGGPRMPAAKPDGGANSEGMVATTGKPEEPTLGQMIGRIGLETAAGLGGTVLGARGGPLGAMAGSGLGTYLGSRAASATFDPVEDPHGEALTSGTVSALFTPIGGAAAKLFGKERVLKEGAKEAMEFFTKKGVTPPPGTVLKSELVQDVQNIAEGAFGMGGRITAMREAAEHVTEQEIKAYSTQFAAAEKAAKELYKKVDEVAPHLRIDLSGMNKILDDIEKSKLLVGVPDQVKSIFTRIRANQNVTFEQAQELRTTLLNMGRLIDDVDPEAARVIARRLEPYLDQAIEEGAKRVKLKSAGGATVSEVWEQANTHWLQHKQGIIIDELIKSASNAGNVSGKALLNKLEKSAMAERLTGPQRAEMRRLAAALAVAEDKTGSGAFKFIGRQAQFVGGLGLVTGTAPVAGTVALLGPPALAWIMSNPKIANLLITGVRNGPGTETGIRALTQLTSVLQRQGLLPIDRADAGVPAE